MSTTHNPLIVRRALQTPTTKARSRVQHTRITDLEAPNNRVDIIEGFVWSDAIDDLRYKDIADTFVWADAANNSRYTISKELWLWEDSADNGPGPQQDGIELWVWADSVSNRIVPAIADVWIWSDAVDNATAYQDVADVWLWADAIDNAYRPIRDTADTWVWADLATISIPFSGQTWLINEAGMAFEYTGYAFDSLARVGENYLAVNDTSVYQLSGNTDDGAAIIARLRSGLSDNQNPGLKRPVDVIIDGEAAGDLIVKLLVADPAGVTEHWYLSTRGATATPTERYVKLGRGALAKFLGWEIVNKAGVDFEINGVVLQYLDTIRRRGRR